MNPSVGNVSCPHCSNPDATVHREKIGQRRLYYRCYGGPNGDCGTIQIRGPGGQLWIEKHLIPLGPIAVEKEAAEAAGEVKAAAREVERTVEKKKGFFEGLLEE